MTTNKNSNKSMFLYTALIFFVAIILIIISFFGQTNLEKKQPSAETQNQTSSTEDIGSGITQKASVLSQDNVDLINENKSLKEELQSEKELVSSLQDENEILKINISNYNLLTNVYQYVQSQKIDDAKEILSIINYDGLTEEQKVIYDNLKNILG